MLSRLFKLKGQTPNAKINAEDFFAQCNDNLAEFADAPIHEIDIKGVKNKVVYLKGRRDYPLLYFVHGLGATYKFFGEGMLYFNKLGYSVLTHSRAGEHEELASPISLESILFEMSEILLGYRNKNIHLIASSFGGILSLLMAEKMPLRIKSLTTIGSFLTFPWSIGHDVIYEVLKNLNVKSLPVRNLGPFAPPIKYIKKRSTAMMEMVLSEYEQFPPSSFVHYLEVLRKIDYINSPPKVDIPMLFIQGKEDDMVPIKCYHELYHAYPHAERSLMKHCIHGPFMSRPVATYSRIEKFLAQNS